MLKVGSTDISRDDLVESVAQEVSQTDCKLNVRNFQELFICQKTLIEVLILSFWLNTSIPFNKIFLTNNTIPPFKKYILQQ